MDSPALYEVTYVCDGVAGKSRQFHVVAVSIEDAISDSRQLLESPNGWAVAEARCLTAGMRVYCSRTAAAALAMSYPSINLVIEAIRSEIQFAGTPAVRKHLQALLKHLESRGRK